MQKTKVEKIDVNWKLMLTMDIEPTKGSKQHNVMISRVDEEGSKDVLYNTCITVDRYSYAFNKIMQQYKRLYKALTKISEICKKLNLDADVYYEFFKRDMIQSNIGNISDIISINFIKNSDTLVSVQVYNKDGTNNTKFYLYDFVKSIFIEVPATLVIIVDDE